MAAACDGSTAHGDGSATTRVVLGGPAPRGGTTVPHETVALDPARHGAAHAGSLQTREAVCPRPHRFTGDLSIRGLVSWEGVSWNRCLWVARDGLLGSLATRDL